MLSVYIYSHKNWVNANVLQNVNEMRLNALSIILYPFFLDNMWERAELPSDRKSVV